jgi:hypothetical protein
MDYPQAFPTVTVRMGDNKLESMTQRGMSLRDYFAGQALIGFINISPKTTETGDITKILTKASYQLADAMLEQREVQDD